MRMKVSLDTVQSAGHVVTLVAVLAQLSQGALISFGEVPQDVVVSHGKQTQFNCSAVSINPSAKPVYFWKFNGSFIANDSKHGFLYRGGRLIIQHVNETVHQGRYQCIAFLKEYGAIISLPAYLHIAYLTISSEYNSTYRTKESASLLVKAPVIRGNPEPYFWWQYQNRSNGIFFPINIIDGYLTRHGNLLFPSISKTFSTKFKLFVSHPTISGGYTDVAEISVQVKGPSPADCPDSSVVFPLQERDKMINEGQSVLLECIGVAKRCKDRREVRWEFKGISYDGRYSINNFKKSNEGVYACLVKIGNRKEVGYNVTLTVRSKPVVWVSIPQDLDVNAATQISSGFVKNAIKVEWYSNGDKITSATNLFKITANNKLSFLKPSRSQSGVYQVFFSNLAGTIVQNINIFVDSGYGRKVSGSSGNVSFVPPLSAPTGVQFASWLIQVPAIRTVHLSITKPPKCSIDDTTELRLYQGSTSNGVLISRICQGPSFRPIIRLMQGPFITLVLATKDLKNSGFFIQFDVNPAAFVTTLPPTTVTSTSTGTYTSRTTPLTQTSTSAGTTSFPPDGPKRKAVGSDLPIGGIIGGICGAILLIAVVLAVFWYRRRTEKKKTTRGQTADIPMEKHDGQQSLPRNTYMMRRPGADQHAPRFTVQPNGRPMPDVIPPYDAVADRFDMGFLGQCQDDTGNQTYETVEDVLRSGGAYGGQNLGNLAYQPGRAPKQVIGRRIPSGPNSRLDASFIRTDISPRPLDHPMPQLGTQEETYDTVDDGGDYLMPVESRPRVASMEGRPLPSPTDSKEPSPLYHTLLESEGTSRENSTYESPDDVIDEMKSLENPASSQRSENCYAALQQHVLPSKENAFYEPLTLERNAKLPSFIDNVDRNGVVDDLQSETSTDRKRGENSTEVETEYSDAYEPASKQKDGTKLPGETATNDDDHNLSASNKNHHEALGGRISSTYETLEDAKDGMANYQTLTLPRRASIDDGLYTPI